MGFLLQVSVDETTLTAGWLSRKDVCLGCYRIICLCHVAYARCKSVSSLMVTWHGEERQVRVPFTPFGFAS